MNIIFGNFDKARKEKREKREKDEVEYLRQLVGSELFNRARGMSHSVALKALELIKKDVEADSINPKQY